MDIYKTARFYALAPDALLDRFEDALDAGDSRAAWDTRDLFLHGMRTAIVSDYLAEEPVVGDLVHVSDTGEFARLLNISDDRELAIVRTWVGCRIVRYELCRRMR